MIYDLRADRYGRVEVSVDEARVLPRLPPPYVPPPVRPLAPRYRPFDLE